MSEYRVSYLQGIALYQGNFCSVRLGKITYIWLRLSLYFLIIPKITDYLHNKNKFMNAWPRQVGNFTTKIFINPTCTYRNIPTIFPISCLACV